MTTKITVETIIRAPIDQVWEAWIEPQHIIHWNAASDDWHCPSAKNDLRVGGKFSYRMEAKDKCMGFDFEGVYTEIIHHQKITYTMDDDRLVEVHFEADGSSTNVTETFDAESTHPVEMQQAGWQSILDKFRDYVEPEK